MIATKMIDHVVILKPSIGKALAMMAEQRIETPCKACGALVTPEGAASRHRNHCPHCLSSLHVDEEPGDRACTCRGIMEPVGVWVRKGGEWALIHRCRACGALRSNRIAADDNPALLLSIALRPLAQPPFPLSSLSGVDLSREMRHNEGNDRQEADA